MGDDAHLASALTKELAGQLRAGSLTPTAQRQAGTNDKSLIVKLSEGGTFADVDVSITGSVLREGSNLRSQVKLTRSSDGKVIWNGTKSRPITDLPLLARLIAQEVATRIGARLPAAHLPNTKSLSPELYDLILRGSYLKSRYDPDDLALAVDDFDEAVQMDSVSAPTLKLREAAELQLLAWGGQGSERESKLVAAGMLRRVPQRELDQAERLVEQADASLRSGQLGTACTLVNSAIDSDPRSAPAYALRALISARTGNIRESFSDAEIVTQLGRPLWGDALRVVATVRAGDTTTARKLAQRTFAQARAHSGRLPLWDARFVAIALSEVHLASDAAAIFARVDPSDPRLRWAREDPMLQGAGRASKPPRARS